MKKNNDYILEFVIGGFTSGSRRLVWDGYSFNLNIIDYGYQDLKADYHFNDNNFPSEEKNIPETQVDPNEFIVWGYRKLLENRLPRYRKIAQNWGIILNVSDVAKVKSADNFTSLISANLKG